MKSQSRFILVLMSVVFLLSACGEDRGTAGNGDEVNDAFTTQKSVLDVIKETNCYAGPGTDYEIVRLLEEGQYFDILGIDDDVTWIDDDVTWIDDDVTWFQIDPNALVDPDPPYRPLSELSSQSNLPDSEMSVRCWVPRTGVQFTGDLLRLTVVSVTIPTPTPTSQSQPIIQLK